MGMYCRGCYYDLRGQDTPRCPECGRAFDPGDPGSFLEHPGRWHRVWKKLKTYRIPVVTVLTCAWMVCMILGPPRLYARRHYDWRNLTGTYRSIVILKNITIQRIVWQQNDPDIRDFDRKAAVRDLPDFLSPYTERTRIMWGWRLGRAKRVIPGYAIPTAIFALLLIPLVRSRRRWIALGVLALCLTMFYASLNASKITGSLFPRRNHAYLDDYVFIDDLDLAPANGEPSTTIAAYDIWSFEGEQFRIVAFTDGHVEELGDDRAKLLFEAQGLEYPVHAETNAD